MPYAWQQAEEEEEGQYALGQTINWDGFIDANEKYLKEKNKIRTQKHIYDVRNTLEDVAKWYTARGIRPAGVNARNFWECLREYKARGVKDRSVKHRQVKTKATFSWAYRAELFKKDLLERVETWEISDKPVKRSVTEDELDKIVRQIEEEWADDAAGGSRFKSLEARRFFRVRDIAATLGLPETGMRVGEFFGARLCHLSDRDASGRRTILVKETKNGDDRFAFLSKEYCDVAFEPWLLTRLKIETGNDYIFINELGGKIDPGSWGRQWNRYRQSAGIERVIRRHDLRHYSSSKHDAIDIEMSKKIVGHKSDQAHDIYSHTEVEALKVAHDAAAPISGVLANYQARVAALAAKPAAPVKKKRVYTK